MNKQPIYQEGQEVYLPLRIVAKHFDNFREGALIGALTKSEIDRNKRLIKIASGRPWSIKQIIHIGRDTYHVLEQRGITDTDTDGIFTWNTIVPLRGNSSNSDHRPRIRDPPTNDVLDLFQPYLSFFTQETQKKMAQQLSSLGHGKRFRIKKSKRKSRKRRSVKRKASRKRKKKTVKELRAECKAQGLVYDPKTKKCRVSKRRSAKRKSRKVSRKRRSAKRKSRKRRSAKRKVSRKRRSAKRKSRKRKSRKSSRKKVIGGKMRTIHKSKNPIPYDEDWAKGFVTHIGPGGGGGVNNYTGTKKVPTRRILDARKKLIDKIYFLHDQLVALDSSLVKDMFAVEILNPTEWRDPPQYMDRDDLKHYVKIMTVDVKELLKANKKKSRKNKFRNGDGKPKKNPGKEPPTAYAHCWSPLPAKSKGFGKLDRECMRKVDAYRGKITLDYGSSKWGEPSSRYS